MSSYNFTPTPNPTNPGTAGAPFYNANLNPYGSNYATAYSYDESKLIQAAIEYAIFDAVPEKYKALKVILSNPMMEKNLDEFSYFEKTFGRSTITAFDSPIAANPMTITLAGTYATLQDMPCVVGDVLTHPDGNAVIVTAISHSAVANSSTITVASQTGAGNVPAVTAGETFAVQAPLVSDGMNYFLHYQRMNTVERYNYIQLFRRASRWSRIELQKMLNAGTTNYVDMDKNEKLEQLRTDLFVSMFNGTRGEFAIAAPTAGSYYAKTTGGIYPLMVAAGSQHATTPLAGLQGSFEALAFDTDYQKDGGLRMIYGTGELLYELSKLWKEPGINYTPNDKIGDLNLTEYKLGTMRFIPVACELFRETSAFPASWQNRLVVVDPSTVNPAKIKGIPYIEMGVTDNMQRGTREDYQDWWVQANLGLEFNNPLAAFYIDIV